MVNKKAYLKTLEALIAIVLLLVFITTALNINKPETKQKTPDDIKLIQDTVFREIESNPDLRQALINNDDSHQITDMIDDVMIETLNYKIQICTELNQDNCPSSEIVINTIPDPQEKTIYSDSLLIREPSGIASMRLFLWRKLE